MGGRGGTFEGKQSNVDKSKIDRSNYKSEGDIVKLLQSRGLSLEDASSEAYDALEAITAGQISPEEAEDGYGISKEQYQELTDRALMVALARYLSGADKKRTIDYWSGFPITSRSKSMIEKATVGSFKDIGGKSGAQKLLNRLKKKYGIK